MKRSTLAVPALLCALSILPTVSLAEEQGPENPAPVNLSVASEYRYRGISQTRFQPAAQGGIDFAAKNGLYVGTWASTIKWIKDAGGNANFEWDFYGGYKGEITKDLTFDVGGLYYYYHRNDLNPSANTFEVYGALTYSVFTLKYSHSTTNLFGFTNSKGSGYLDLTANYDLGDGWSVAPHIGHQWVSHFNKASYTDYSLTVGKDIGKGWNLSAALVGTDADKTTYVSPSGQFLGRTTVVAMAKYNF